MKANWLVINRLVRLIHTKGSFNNFGMACFFTSLSERLPADRSFEPKVFGSFFQSEGSFSNSFSTATPVCQPPLFLMRLVQSIHHNGFFQRFLISIEMGFSSSTACCLKRRFFVWDPFFISTLTCQKPMHSYLVLSLTWQSASNWRGLDFTSNQGPKSKLNNSLLIFLLTGSCL